MMAADEEKPVHADPLGGDPVLDDDPTHTGGPTGDPVAVDESRTPTSPSADQAPPREPGTKQLGVPS
jgi:hypothetical protein